MAKIEAPTGTSADTGLGAGVGRRVWKCYICGKEEHWGPTWMVGNSIRGQEDVAPLLVVCSDRCKDLVGDIDIALRKLYRDTKWVPPPPQFGLHRFSRYDKPEKKKKRKPLPKEGPAPWGLQ